MQESCSGGSNTACPGQTYYGIKQDNNPGGGTVIRKNRIRGHDDNTSPCGDEDSGRELAEGSPVLALVGAGPWTNHDLEIYDNTFEDARDDGMELDGICVNARVYRNTIHNAQNPFSAAPVMPGPYFFVRNVASGTWGDAGFKMNTAGNSAVPSRHVFVYQNTFVRATQGSLVHLWYAVEGDHNVPIHDFVFRNKIFSTPMGGPCTDAYIAFQAATAQEAHGAFGEPGIAADFVPMKGALVVDRAVAIPGINDHFIGAGPDVGAYELGGAPPMTTSSSGSPSSGGEGGSLGTGSGSGSGGGSGGAGSAKSSSDGCGCVVAGGDSDPPATALFGMIALGILARRKVRKPTRARVLAK